MKELDATQVEQLRTIGAYLGRERKERGVSLDEIAIKTYIPLRLLQALEEGHVERLPEPVFVQGFMRRFADAIGLDGVALAKTFSPQPSFLVERNETAVERPTLEPQPTDDQAGQPMADAPMVEPKAGANSAVEPIYVPPEYIQRAPLPAKRSSLPWVVLGTAVVLLLGVGLVTVLNRSKPATDARNETPVPDSNAVASSPQPRIAASSSTASSPQASNNPSLSASVQPDATPAGSPIQVTVNLADDSWFQIVADGKTEFEGILKKGEQKTWTAQKKLVLQAGNAGAVSVSYNQGEAKRLGAPGEVKDVTFSAGGKSKAGLAN